MKTTTLSILFFLSGYMLSHAQNTDFVQTAISHPSEHDSLSIEQTPTATEKENFQFTDNSSFFLEKSLVAETLSSEKEHVLLGGIFYMIESGIQWNIGIKTFSTFAKADSKKTAVFQWGLLYLFGGGDSFTMQELGLYLGYEISLLGQALKHEEGNNIILTPYTGINGRFTKTELGDGRYHNTDVYDYNLGADLHFKFSKKWGVHCGYNILKEFTVGVSIFG